MRNVNRVYLALLLLSSLVTGCARTRARPTSTTGDGRTSTATTGAAITSATDTPVPLTPTEASATRTPTLTAAVAKEATKTSTPTARAVASRTSTPTPATRTPTATASPAKATTTPTTPPTPTSAAPAPPPPNWEPDGRIKDNEYTGRVEIDAVTFLWSRDATYLYGAMSARTVGWIAVGFAPQSQMEGANFVFGYVDRGQVVMADMFGVQPTGPGSHPADETLGGSNDIVDFGGFELDGITVIEFKIPLDSGDAYDRALVPNTRYKLIAAIGEKDDFTSYHVSRALGEFELE